MTEYVVYVHGDRRSAVKDECKEYGLEKWAGDLIVTRCVRRFSSAEAAEKWAKGKFGRKPLAVATVDETTVGKPRTRKTKQDLTLFD